MKPAKPARTFWICLLFCFVVGAAFLAYPVYVIRPFRAQQPTELRLALAAIRYRPWVMVLTVLCSLGMFIWYWRREMSRSRRAFSTIAVASIFAIALLSRINIYELMFHPLDRISFSTAAQSKLDGAEKVIAVNLRRTARAYPIRIISYHHIVNDLIDGVPIVATY